MIFPFNFVIIRVTAQLNLSTSSFSLGWESRQAEALAVIPPLALVEEAAPLRLPWVRLCFIEIRVVFPCCVWSACVRHLLCCADDIRRTQDFQASEDNEMVSENPTFYIQFFIEYRDILLFWVWIRRATIFPDLCSCCLSDISVQFRHYSCNCAVESQHFVVLARLGIQPSRSLRRHSSSGSRRGSSSAPSTARATVFHRNSCRVPVLCVKCLWETPVLCRADDIRRILDFEASEDYEMVSKIQRSIFFFHRISCHSPVLRPEKVIHFRIIICG